jgi:hypothetical protein
MSHKRGATRDNIVSVAEGGTGAAGAETRWRSLSFFNIVVATISDHAFLSAMRLQTAPRRPFLR